jgi:hypothetical protein
MYGGLHRMHMLGHMHGPFDPLLLSSNHEFLVGAWVCDAIQNAKIDVVLKICDGYGGQRNILVVCHVLLLLPAILLLLALRGIPKKKIGVIK